MGDRTLRENISVPARMNQLQFLRFLAFLNVFLQHTPSWNFFSYPTFYGTVSSISFYFILSGMISGYSGYGRTKKPTGKDVLRYLWHKMIKFLPVYFLVNFAYFILSGAVIELVQYRFDSFLSYAFRLAKNLLFIQAWSPLSYDNYAGISWFFSVIMFLYAFNLPGVYLLNKIERHPKSNWIFRVLMGMILMAAVQYHYSQRFSENMYFWTYIFPPARMGEYFLGMILGFMVRKEWPKKYGWKNRKAVFTLLEFAVLVFWLVYIQAEVNTGPFYWGVYAVYWILPNMLLLSVFAFGFGAISDLFKNKFLVFLGDITANCVLLHTLIITIYCLFTGLTQGGSRWVCLISLGICLFTTVLMASLMTPKKY